ncbi:MAG: hypothetical protein QM579_14200 [Desulfovibrio sp.]|uniref:hypothetical protein n=1 Tax=Desulfovibrio sp. TaxID=885 RepID=UPI0039E33E4B
MAAMQHTAAQWREVVFLADFFRLPPTKTLSSIKAEAHWHYFADSFFHLCRLPAAQGTGLPVRQVRHNDQSRQDMRQFFARCADAATAPEQSDWLALCRQGVTDEACAFAKQHILNRGQRCRDVLVVGYSLSTFMASVLTACGLAWINVHIHPASFMPDLVFAFSTNVPEIANTLARNSMAEEDFERCADWQKARYAPNTFLNYVPENALLVLAQDWMDPLPLTPDYQYNDFSAHEQALLTLAAQHPVVLTYVNRAGPYMPGPGLSRQDETLLREKINAIMLPVPHLFLKNTVMMLSHPSISTVLGLNSKRLDEARWFGKNVIQLVPSPVYFRPDAPVTAESQCAITPSISCFAAEFWALLVRQTDAAPRTTAVQAANSMHLPNARLIFRGGGSDFDDSNSATVAAGLAQARSEATQARHDALLHGLRHSLEQEPPAAPLPAAPDVQKNYALFCAGDENYLFPAIVALESTRRRTGQADAFYVTDIQCLSDAGKALLDKYGIEPLHSKDGSTFDIKHMHTTPEAYVQLFVPEMLHARGYAYSLGVHADVVCVRPFHPDEIFARTSFVATSGANPAARFFSITDNHTSIQQEFDPSPRSWLEPLNNPGVFFANNAALTKMQLSQQSAQAYAKIGPEFLFYNEETLLNLFCMLDKEFCLQLDDRFNMFNGSVLSENVPFFLHYLNSNKPWRFAPSSLRRSDWLTPLCPLFSIWHREAKAIFDEHDYNTFIATSGV